MTSTATTKKYSTLILIVLLPSIFAIAATNTIPVLGGLIVYLMTLLLVLLISLVTDREMNSNFKNPALILFGGSFFCIVLGISTFSLQKSLNAQKAQTLINEVEHFKKTHGQYPKDDQVNLPQSRNGLYSEQFFYYFPDVEKDAYIIRYFDGFWDTKVYVSSQQKWYIDD